MSDLVLTLTPEVRQRLDAMAEKIERSVEDCAQIALAEFLENWEGYLQTIEALKNGEEERPVLRAVND
ncbi:MAG TPA: ribbon-helix-helix protein, CopG family [Rhodospirillaceae bacterium]|nr:ribbon-helix-helix protein, CopG family [Rhodospirillaceae bacterium]